MSIADEARAEAERLYRAYPQPTQSLLISGFEHGAEWQASRKPEAAPSSAEGTLAQIRRYLERFGPGDMHSQRVMVEALEEILDGAEVAWAPSDTDRAWKVERLRQLAESYRMDLKSPSVAAMLDDAADMLATSQPVQVEVSTGKVAPDVDA